MRARVVGLAVIGLGGLVLAAGITADGWVPLSAVELRLDESFETVALGAQVSYLDPVPVAPVTSEDVSVSVRVRGDEDAGDAGDDTAVWEYLATIDDANGTLVGTSSAVACLDRRSAEAVDCVAESVDGERTDIQGLTVRFPSDTEQRDYDLWDTTVRQSLPARFVGSERLDGLPVYRFEQEVPAQVIRTVPVPGTLVGSSEAEFPAEVVHSNSRSLLVEPLSGVIVSVEESPLTELRGPDGAAGAVLLAGTFGWSDETVEDAVARAEDIRDERAELRPLVRWTGIGAGTALLAAGALLAARRRPARPDHAQDEPARVPVPSA
ncbi:DUF3068 domain-containing protein [Candidatus Blastococcus massiliensis]|uniref:DUF3068 domain-containing protein n=1 Tax=Candidatus Blastococcus massiliensis TaxID=1470358 RepID=UPI0004B234C2|nr:DUF3068 domain-containing protein [Candidatus Blastococcus massiliensis]